MIMILLNTNGSLIRALVCALVCVCVSVSVCGTF